MRMSMIDMMVMLQLLSHMMPSVECYFHFLIHSHLRVLIENEIDIDIVEDDPLPIQTYDRGDFQRF